MSDVFQPYTTEDLHHHLRIMEYAGDPLNEYVLRQFHKPPPASELVYHYASKAGFEGIINSGCLWASPAHTLNDLDEMYDGVQCIKNSLKKAKIDIESSSSASESDDIDKNIRSLVGSYFHDKWSPPNKFEIYTVSFSEDGDSSNQWLSYVEEEEGKSVKGRGFALGFSVEHLLLAAQPLGYSFNACKYDREHKREFIDGALDVAVRYIKTMLIEKKLNFGATMEWAEEKFFYSILPMLPFFKNHTFHSEMEWRVAIFGNENRTWDEAAVKLRNEERDILKFRLYSTHPKFNGHSYLPIFRVMAGCGISDKEMQEAHDLLNSNGYRNVPIIRSECRLR